MSDMQQSPSYHNLDFLSEAQNANMRLFASRVHVGHAPGYQSDYSHEAIKSDVLSLKEKQIDTLIMVGDADAIQSGEVDQIVKEHTSITPVRTYGGIPLKTVDYTAPSQSQMAAVSAMTTHAVFTGKNVYICCGAGIGRSGTYVRAAVMDFLGVDEEVADEVCEHYYPETELEEDCQEEALKQYAHAASQGEAKPRASRLR